MFVLFFSIFIIFNRHWPDVKTRLTVLEFSPTKVRFGRTLEAQPRLELAQLWMRNGGMISTKFGAKLFSGGVCVSRCGTHVQTIDKGMIEAK